MKKRNIDLLLGKLSRGSFAYKLVNRLKEARRENWHDALDQIFKAQLENKMRELRNAEDQKS